MNAAPGEAAGTATASVAPAVQASGMDVPLREWLLLVLALLASAALLWAISGEPLVAAGFAGGIVAIGALVRVAVRLRPTEVVAEPAAPDPPAYASGLGGW